MSNDIKRDIVLTKLNVMFRGDHFDVCAITDCKDLLGPYLEMDALDCMQALKTLHCVKWRDMPIHIRKLVPEWVAAVLNLDAQFDGQNMNMNGKYEAGIGQYRLE